MSGKQTGSITLRFGIENEASVRAALKTLGRDGENAAKQIQRAMDGKGKWNGIFQNIRSESQAAQSSLGGLAGSFGQLGPAAGLVARILPVIGAALVVGKVAEYAETWGLVSQRLVAAQIDMAKVPAVQMRVAETAFNARTELEATATLYSRLLTTTRDFGATQGEVARATEVVTRALSVGGQTTGEISSTIVQLTQGFAAGRFQGDELRSVLENSIPITQAIAREFGVAAGELKKLGEEGQLTADRVFKAIINAGNEIDETFSKMAATPKQALGQLETATISLMGEMDRATGTSNTFAGALGGVASAAMNAAKALNQMNNQSALQDKMKALDEQERLARAAAGEQVALKVPLRVMGMNIANVDSGLKYTPGGTDEGKASLDRELRRIESERRSAYSALIPQVDTPDSRGLQRLADGIAEAKSSKTAAFFNAAVHASARAEKELAIEDIVTRLKKDAAEKGVEFNADKAFEAAQKIWANENDSSGGGSKKRKDAFGTADQRFNFRTQIGVASATEKRTRFTNELNEALKRGVITEEERAAALAKFNKELEDEDKWTQMRMSKTPYLQRLANDAQDLQAAMDSLTARSLDDFADGLVDIATGAKDAGAAFEDMTKSILSGILKIMIQKSIIGPIAQSISGFDFKSILPFASGGIMTSGGSIPLRAYAGGGVADTPQMALFGEGRLPEAYVPLPNGRSIPVQLRGVGNGGGGVEIHIHEAPGVKAETRKSQNATGGQRLDIVMKQQIEETVAMDIANGGGISRALESSYNMRRQV